MNATEEKVEKLSFYTTGEGFTNLLVDYFQSGLFSLYEKLLIDNLDEAQMKEAFRLRISLEGDTRKGDLICKFADKDPENFPETLYYAIKTASRDTLNERTIELEWMSKHNENLAVLLKYYTVEEILNLCHLKVLEEEGYAVTEWPTTPEDRTINGVILKDGRFVECGFQDHVNLFPILYATGLADAGDWTDSKEVIHISSSQMNGTAANNLGDNWRGQRASTPRAQIDTMWMLRNYISELYGSYSQNTCVPNLVRKYTIDVEAQGGKWGNLAFLKEYYPHIKTPRTSTKVEDFSGEEKVFMRTSPESSLPGLLNSRLIKPNEHDVTKARNFMQLEFEKFKTLKHDNELHWFFQEFLEGSNGVCHIKREPNLSDTKYLFRYQLSPNQGDVVKGKQSHEKLSPELEKQLEKIGVELFDDLKESIQLEFVVHNDEIWIVQLRILENEFEKGIGGKRPENPLAEGFTFSKGSLEVKVSDILIVSEDADSEALLGKKALIVENNVEFSHILALSKALRIPSMFATGPIDLSSEESVYFNASLKESYITKLKRN